MNNRDNEQDQTLPKRRGQFLIFFGVLIGVFYMLTCPDSEVFNNVLLLCSPSFFLLYNIHVQHTEYDAWWTNWALHKFLSLIFVFIFGFRLIYGGSQRHDLLGLGIYLYVYHATGDVEL